MNDILAIFRQYGVPFNDPCDASYQGVCHCDEVTAAEQIITQSPITVCGISHIAGTPITDILAGVCVPNGDDDWRFSSGSTHTDHIYRTGNVSIGSMTDSHALRVDGTFAFTPVGGKLFDYDNGVFQYTSVSGLAGIALNLNDASVLGRDTIGSLDYQVGYASTARIQAVAATDFTLTDSPTQLEFYVTENTTVSTALVLQHDYRARWSKYGTFSDGIPESLLGLITTPDNTMTRHVITGTPTTGTILGIGSSGLEWLSPAAASSLPAVNGLSQVSSQYELGGTLSKDTEIINTNNVFTFGNSTNTIYTYVEQDSNLGRLTVFSRNSTNNDEVSIVTYPEYHSIECNQDGIDSVFRVGNDSISVTVSNGTDLKFIDISSENISITGLRTFPSEAAAIADGTLPSNAIYRVTGDANLKIK